MDQKQSRYRPNLIGIMTAIRDAHCVEGAHRIVLDALALRANPTKGWTAWPSYRLLAEDTILNEKYIRQVAKQLEEKGLIHRKFQRNTTNLFTVRFRRIVRLAEEQARIRLEQEEAEEAAKEPIDPDDLEGEEEVYPNEDGNDRDDNDDNNDPLKGWGE